MKFLEAFNNLNIRIPLLQRDYVQGEREEVISPFLDALMTKECELNYIYGYEEEGYFVPIDGQQRVITLWLLFLYLFSFKHEENKYKIELTFLSREFANDFCRIIKVKLSSVIDEAKKSKKNLQETLENKKWFIKSWSKNISVRNMLKTLDHIYHTVNEDNIDKIFKNVEDNVSFSFLNMKEINGVDDDIYIKMNGRGRALSAFENLKSWMDEKVQDLPIASEWRFKIDNQWADMCWENRNKNQEHPEEIDDEQLCLFYNLLVLFHIRNNKLVSNIENLRKEDVYNFQFLLDFLEIENENVSNEEIVAKIFNYLLNAHVIPLIWVERIELMPKEFFEKAKSWLDRLYCLCKEFNGIDLNIGGSKDITMLYSISMHTGTTFANTLPLLYSLIMSPQEMTPLADWMRVMRNLIFNTEIDRNNLPDILNAIDNFANICKTKNIYDALIQQDNNDVDKVNKSLKGFNGKQIKEEIFKSAQEFKIYYDDIKDLENGAFFMGRISIIFKIIDINKLKSSKLLDEFHRCSLILLNIFDGSNGGINPIFENNFLFRRALMACAPYYYGYYDGGSVWTFCANIEEWKRLLFDDDKEKSSLCFLIRDILLTRVNEKDVSGSLVSAMNELIIPIDDNYEKKLDSQDIKDKFYLHFVHCPGIWEFMGAKRCIWNYDSNYDIAIKSAKSNNSNRMELRTYALYLDYADSSIHKEMIKDREGWNLGIWPKESTCFVFDLNFSSIKSKIEIDVFHRRTKEDDYAISLFITPNSEGDDKVIDTKILGEKYLKPILGEKINCFKINEENGRYELAESVSRKEMILLLRDLLPLIRYNIQN